MAKTVQSKKARGRKLQQHVRDKLYETFTELEEGDIRSTSMGAGGVDLQLSPQAKRLFPYSVECKNQESLSVWNSFAQAESNCETGTKPLLVFKRNRTDVYCMIKLEDFLEVLTNGSTKKL